MSDIKVEFSNVFLVSEIGIWVAVMAAPFECLEASFFCYLTCKARHTKNTYDLFSLHLDAKNRRVGGEKQSLAFLVVKRNSHNFKSLFMWFSTFLLLKDFYHKVSSSFFRIFLYCYLLHILAHCSTFLRFFNCLTKVDFFGVWRENSN